ncbi:MAG: DUF3368 domain-containing protein [Chthoniobacterales bacterium]
MRLVLNASPVICLAKAGLIDKVLSVAEEVVVPQLVADELLVANDKDAAVVWIQTEVGQHALRYTKEAPALVLAWDLGAGESSVLAAVVDMPGSIAVLDDLAARRCAAALGIDFNGTLGLLLMAKKAGLIASLRHALRAVVDAGLFVSPKHMHAILEAANE